MDLTTWLEFFVEGLATQLAEVKERGEAAIRIDVIAKQRQLNERQAMAIQLLLESPTLDIRTLETAIPGVSRRTLQRDLTALEMKGLLEREGETNNVVY